jgi:cobaltochelatase CobN
MATMLEAARKGYWQTDDPVLKDLARRYAENVSKNGMSGHITSGGNDKLHAMVQGLITGEDQQSELLLTSYVAQFEAQTKQADTSNIAESKSAAAPAQVDLKELLTEAAPAPSLMQGQPVDRSSALDPSVPSGAAPPSPTVRGSQLTPVSKNAEQVSSNNQLWLIGLTLTAILLGGFVFKRRI